MVSSETSRWFLDEVQKRRLLDYKGESMRRQQLTKLSLQGAGHMVPQWRPQQAFHMMYRYLKNMPYWVILQLICIRNKSSSWLSKRIPFVLFLNFTLQNAEKTNSQIKPKHKKNALTASIIACYYSNDNWRSNAFRSSETFAWTDGSAQLPSLLWLFQCQQNKASALLVRRETIPKQTFFSGSLNQRVIQAQILYFCG